MGYKPIQEQTLVEKLRIRAFLRRMLREKANKRTPMSERSSDKIADLCEEAANKIEELTESVDYWQERAVRKDLKD